jgi:NitT/TauT family transport system ATP-binding protein
MASVSVRNVSKTYPTSEGSLQVIRDISFEVADGEFVAIVGPSGCGKSTLLRMVAGLRSSSAGQIDVDGVAVNKPIRVGMVFQAPALLPWRSTLKNVLLAAELAGMPTRAYERRAHSLLELVGLGGFQNRRPGELSGGMQQRVALCRALLTDPTLLLMDEPFGALDALTRDEMNSELLRIWTSSGSKKTIIFITHSIPEAVFLADRVIVMSRRPAVIAADMKSPLERPRTLEMRGSQPFGDQTVKIYRLLQSRRGASAFD